MKAPYFEVLCNTHGKQQASVTAYKSMIVVVGRPHSKRERNTSGCPSCKLAKQQGS